MEDAEVVSHPAVDLIITLQQSSIALRLNECLDESMASAACVGKAQYILYILLLA